MFLYNQLSFESFLYILFNYQIFIGCNLIFCVLPGSFPSQSFKKCIYNTNEERPKHRLVGRICVGVYMDARVCACVSVCLETRCVCMCVCLCVCVTANGV